MPKLGVWSERERKWTKERQTESNCTLCVLTNKLKYRLILVNRNHIDLCLCVVLSKYSIHSHDIQFISPSPLLHVGNSILLFGCDLQAHSERIRIHSKLSLKIENAMLHAHSNNDLFVPYGSNIHTEIG